MTTTHWLAALGLHGLAWFTLLMFVLHDRRKPTTVELRIDSPGAEDVMNEGKLHDALADMGMRATVFGPDGQARELAADEPGYHSGMRERVFVAMVNHNSRPMSAEEIADIIGVELYRVTPRLFELEQAGRIERTDERHTNRSGKTAAKFRLK